MNKNQISMTREKLRFFLGLSLLITFIYFSLLRQQQFSAFEYGVFLSLTGMALVFDYLKVGQFLTLVSKHESANCSHEFAVESALAGTLKSPFLIKALKSELLTLYYAFFSSFERSGVVTRYESFSYAKSSNAHDVYLFVALSQLPFLPFIHIFIEHIKGSAPAWVITFLTLWSVIWFLAQVEAIRFRPIELSKDRLFYRFGLSWCADIPLNKIKSARRVNVAETLHSSDFFLSPFGSKRNVVLEFESKIRFAGPYMQKRLEDKAAISLDDPSHFLAQLASRGIAID